MSFIVKGIDLPEKENQMYMMELYADGLCSVVKIEDGECYELAMLSKAEAIQIPKGHGAIKDTDEIIALFKRVTSINKSIMIDAIQQTDTILEAEETNGD